MKYNNVKWYSITFIVVYLHNRIFHEERGKINNFRIIYKLNRLAANVFLPHVDNHY